MNDANRALIERYWVLMAGNDFATVGAVLADDFVFEMPQSGERIRGRSNYAAMNTAYPAQGRWRFDVRIILVDGDAAMSETDVTDGVARGRALSLFELRAGLIARLVEYWPEPFAPSADRARWVEPGPVLPFRAD